MDTIERLLLVDGHHLFHRTYNALPQSIVGTDGAPIQGVYGFAGAFLRLARRFSPTHVCVPFNPPGPPFRRAFYPDYRTGRPRGTPKEVANFDRQVAQVGQVLDHLEVRHPLVPGFEADDVMGTLATAATTAGLPVTIVSGDRDLLQMVGPRVDVFMPKGQEGDLYTPAVMQERWGVWPDQFTDLKALIGDVSDNIPGVPGDRPQDRRSPAGPSRHGRRALRGPPVAADTPGRSAARIRSASPSIVAWSPSSPPWTSRPTWRGIAGPASSRGRRARCSPRLVCVAEVAGVGVRTRG